MQINPGLTMVALDDKTLQIGSGARAIHIDNCTPAIRNFLHALHPSSASASAPGTAERPNAGVPDGHELAVGAEHGLSETAVWKLLNLLDPVLVSTPTESAATEGLAHHRPDPDQANALAALHAVTALKMPADSPAHLGTSVVPRSLQDIRVQRAATAIQIQGTGRTGQFLAEQLFRGGIGQLWLWDPEDVTEIDTLLHTRDPKSLGRKRSVALTEYLRGLGVPTSMEQFGTGPEVFPQTHPDAPLPCGDLTVVIGLGGISAETWISLSAAEQTCIPVVIQDDQALVGPWLLPGIAPCPGCWEQLNAGKDPMRTRRVEALAAGRAGNESMPVATALAGLVALQIFNWLDAAPLRARIPRTTLGSVPGVVPGQIIRLSTATGAVTTFTIQPHPDCCAGAHAASA